MLLKKRDNKIEKLKIKKFKLEKELQNFVENNIQELLNLELIKSEFKIENYRIDTLAFDTEAKSFVIIEYKRGVNYSVIDQGYSYLAAILNNKAEAILDYNEIKGKFVKRNEIDWSQTKVIFISQEFSKFQKNSLNFQNLPIELYQIKKYEDNIVLFEEINRQENSEDINILSKSNPKIENVAKEIKTYSLNEHFKNTDENILEIFNVYKKRIEEMFFEIEVKPKKLYIAFKWNNKNIVDFKIQKSTLKLWLNAKKGQLIDSKNLAKDVSEIGHWGNGDYELTIKNLDDLEYILSLIKDTSEL